MVGDCGQTRRLDNVQSLARGQSSAWMDITSMLVMDWTFWEAVHTGLQRRGKATSQEGSGCKKRFRFRERQGHPCVRRVCQRGFWGEKEMNRGSEITNRTAVASFFLTIFRWVVLLRPVSILASLCLSAAHQSQCVWTRHHRFGPRKRV